GVATAVGGFVAVNPVTDVADLFGREGDDFSALTLGPLAVHITVEDDFPVGSIGRHFNFVVAVAATCLNRVPHPDMVDGLHFAQVHHDIVVAAALGLSGPGLPDKVPV